MSDAAMLQPQCHVCGSPWHKDEDGKCPRLAPSWQCNAAPHYVQKYEHIPYSPGFEMEPPIRPVPGAEVVIDTGAARIRELEYRIRDLEAQKAALEVKVTAWKNAAPSGCDPFDAQRMGAHLFWWPDEVPPPLITGQRPNRDVRILYPMPPPVPPPIFKAIRHSK